MPHKKSEYEDYLKFIDEALELARKIPRYFSKFSNHIYCNHQKFVIHIIMQKLKLTTRGVVSFLRSNPTLCMHFGLSKVPVHTTIVRFVSKIKKQINLFLGIRSATNVAVDASGFELESKSFHYRTVWNSDKKIKTRTYMKLSICMDTDTQIILTHKIRKKFRHDNIDFKYLVKDLDVKYIFADKGYDGKKNRRFVINKLKAIPIIPVRRHIDFYGYLKKKKKIDRSKYHQRSKVETVFSVIKRRYGSVLRNRSYATQQVELISKLIAYNLDRKLNYLLLMLEGCTKAWIHKIYKGIRARWRCIEIFINQKLFFYHYGNK